MSAYYGERIRYEDSIIDVGAVADEDLFYLREQIQRQLDTPGFHDWPYTRDADEEAIQFIEDEIYWRWRNYGSLDEDLPNAYRCGIGCCYD
jgi:hypothetical protein